jgi:nicotinamidase-related amidase
MEREDWSAFALLLIDVQKDFFYDDIARAFPDFERNTAELLKLARAEGIDVVHVHAVFQPDGSDWMARYRLQGKIPCIAGTPGAAVLPCATPLPGEKLFIKQTFDAFLNPALDPWLREHGKHFLLVAGLVTGVCDLLTAAAAAQRGYLVALVEDCCGDRPATHQHTLERYPGIFERVGWSGIAARRAAWLADLSATGA